MGFTVDELARRCGGRVRGEANRMISRVATLESAGPSDIAYVASARYHKALADTEAGAVIVTEADAALTAKTALIVDNPRLSFARVATLLQREETVGSGVHPSAVVDPRAHLGVDVYVGAQAVIAAGAVIGARTVIGPRCYVGEDVRIGERSVLTANVTLCRASILGKRCVVQPGAVIGSEGFGYVQDGLAWVKVPQLGRVVIGDDVEIGANTTIDRGALGDTVIGDGVKLDNLIQIAHNVQIGDHTAMAGCVGIAGSAVIGKRCTIGGGVGIAGHLEIGDDVHVTGMSLVGASIPSGETYSSSMSAEPVHQWRKNAARFRHLDEIARRLRKLEQKLEENPEGESFE
jgi:UDP-3-O-[3-hydroxymyristoyl] glucosamine N-acyltransferase